jgi:hypothetical protein
MRENILGRDDEIHCVAIRYWECLSNAAAARLFLVCSEKNILSEHTKMP